jgi:hypothetical protein
MDFTLGQLVKNRQSLLMQIAVCRNFDVSPPTVYLLNQHESHTAQ